MIYKNYKRKYLRHWVRMAFLTTTPKAQFMKYNLINQASSKLEMSALLDTVKKMARPATDRKKKSVKYIFG